MKLALILDLDQPKWTQPSSGQITALVVYDKDAQVGAMDRKTVFKLS